jgi:urease accessory protein UreE
VGRSKLPDFDAERPPELGGLPIFSVASNTAPDQDCAKYSVELAFGERSRSRLKVECRPLLAATLIGANQVAYERVGQKADERADEAGFSAGIVLPRGTILRGGAWVLGEGRALHVLAADEDLLEVSVSGADNPQLALLKAAYHLGNRHVALQVAPTLLKLEYDYVLADMLVAMGLKVQRRYGPFEPEWGAYAAGHHH